MSNGECEYAAARSATAVETRWTSCDVRWDGKHLSLVLRGVVH